MFYVTFHTLSRSSCVEILTQGQFYSDGGDLDSIIVGDDSQPSPNGTYFYYEHSFYGIQGGDGARSANNKIERNRLTLEQAERGCASQNQNSVTWIFS